MSTRSSQQSHRTRELRAELGSNNIRPFIAEQLRVDVERITDRSHFMDDLGADWLDRLELMVIIEEVTGLEFTDDEVDQIKVVGDLIRCIASAENKEVGTAA
jgi:acyl carrier protein